jgi:hypothetical protein
VSWSGSFRSTCTRNLQHFHPAPSLQPRKGAPQSSTLSGTPSRSLLLPRPYACFCRAISEHKALIASQPFCERKKKILAITSATSETHSWCGSKFGINLITQIYSNLNQFFLRHPVQSSLAHAAYFPIFFHIFVISIPGVFRESLIPTPNFNTPVNDLV